jgi:hypothetical protein
MKRTQLKYKFMATLKPDEIVKSHGLDGVVKWAPAQGPPSTPADAPSQAGHHKAQPQQESPLDFEALLTLDLYEMLRFYR